MAKNISVGYIRVSSKDQNESRQLQQMEKLGINERNIYIDKESGKDFQRPMYQAMIATLREGDVVYISSIDRLGRNYQEILQQWSHITKAIKADIVVLDMPLLDTRNRSDLTGTLISDIVLQLLSYVAQKERENIRARQAEGIAIAKQQGKYKGRKQKVINHDLFLKLYAEVNVKKRTVTSAIKELDIQRTSWYRLVKEFESNTGRFAD